MKRRDEDKASFVEFLRSIKFSHEAEQQLPVECPTHFAHFEPQARANYEPTPEEQELIRSAN